MSSQRYSSFVAIALLAIAAPHPSFAGEPAPYAAREGVALADDAARAWSADAVLVYVENDENVSTDGRAARWGYLYYSASLDATRGYSIREDEIVVAEDLGLTFEAPPLSPGWIDSGHALASAEKEVGRELREKHADAHLATMLLVRGAFLTGKPDLTTWLVVYETPGAPSTFVVVDAHSGDVRRTWRG